MSMIDVTCATCGKTSKAPIEAAGKRGRCRGCGAETRIPIPGDSDSDSDSDVVSSVSVNVPKRSVATAVASATVAPAAQSPSSTVSTASSQAASGAAGPSIPPEPWFYGFLETYAQVVMALGLVVCGGSVLVGLAGFAMLMDSHGSSADATTPFLSTLGGALGIIPVLLASAPVLLAVDAARNLRALRYGKAG